MTFSRYPVTISMEITQSCNHRCCYCYNGDRLDSSIKPNQVSLKTYQQVLDAVGRLQPMRINITGGEPLLRRDLAVETMAFCQQNNIECTMNSNLALLEEDDMESFLRHGLRGILTSLYSWREDVHNRMTGASNFKKLVKAVKFAAPQLEILAVNMVVTPENHSDVVKTGLFVKEELGTNNFYVTPMQALVQRQANLMLSRQQAVNLMDALVTLRHQHGLNAVSLIPPMICTFPNPEKYREFFTRQCMGGRTEWAITASGDLKPCAQMGAVSANVLTHTHEQLLEALHEWRVTPEHDDSIVPRECRGCSAVDFCRGGCRSSLAGTKKDIRSRHPYMQKPVDFPMTIEVPLNNYFQQAFNEPLEPICFRQETDGYFCRIRNKCLKLSNAEFVLLQLIKREETLLQKSVIDFAIKYELEPVRFNFFLNRIAHSQPDLVIDYTQLPSLDVH